VADTFEVGVGQLQINLVPAVVQNHDLASELLFVGVDEKDDLVDIYHLPQQRQEVDLVALLCLLVEARQQPVS